MDLGLRDRVIVVVADDEADREACTAVLRAEGADVVAVPLQDADTSRADGVVVYAPLAPGSALLDATLSDLEDDWGALEEVVSAFQSALPGMMERGWGRLVTVTTGAVKSLDDDADERGAVVGLAVLGVHKAVVAEVARFGITTNAVLRDDRTDPTDVANAVAFLLSEPAGYLQGVTVALDGARTSSVF
jgi:NAD(P)-dependent dehydrogenase (short-subunit alcohol dehydrogenase family)